MKKRTILLAIIIPLSIVVLFVSVFCIHIHEINNKWTNRIYPGVKIGNIDVSGKTSEEAKELITEKYQNKILKKNITIKTNDKNYILEYSNINARYNIDEVVKKAYDYGKKYNSIKKYKAIKSPKNTEYTLKFIYDLKTIKELTATIKKEVDKSPSNANIILVNSSFQINPEIDGIKLLDTKLEDDIIDKISGDVKGANFIINAPTEVVKANITKEKLQTINAKVSTFSSDFGSSSYERSTNITLATKSINGKIIMPGQDFSFNDTIGQRTPQKGYQVAPVIIGNKTEADYGGGICQVSTTLYNAVIRANIEATERHPHTLVSHYMGPAMDATVDWGNLDYKFTNTLNYPIYIEAFVENKHIYFNVYSNSSLLSRSYDLVNEIYARVPSQVVYQDDATLPVGQTAYGDETPSEGIKAKAYKNTYENGKLIEHKQVSDDYYKPVNQVIRRGTKKG